MTTAVKVINLGLSKIAASRVSTIEPPKTNLERFMADNYPQWRDEELAARRWVFATEYVTLTLTGDPLVGVAKPYAYLLPNDTLRPVRETGSEWEQRGRMLYSANNTLTILHIQRKSENDFDPLFAHVLACKIAYEACEYVTQSNKKKADALVFYNEAVKRASNVNAFVKGSEAIANEETLPDGNLSFSWVTDRFNV